MHQKFLTRGHIKGEDIVVDVKNLKMLINVHNEDDDAYGNMEAVIDFKTVSILTF